MDSDEEQERVERLKAQQMVGHSPFSRITGQLISPTHDRPTLAADGETISPPPWLLSDPKIAIMAK